MREKEARPQGKGERKENRRPAVEMEENRGEKTGDGNTKRREVIGQLEGLGSRGTCWEERKEKERSFHEQSRGKKKELCNGMKPRINAGTFRKGLMKVDKL